MGRANLGERALDVATIDYEKVVIPDPLGFRGYLESKGLLQQFLDNVKKMLSLKPVDITSEMHRPERYVIEEHIFRYFWTAFR